MLATGKQACYSLVTIGCFCVQVQGLEFGSVEGEGERGCLVNGTWLDLQYSVVCSFVFTVAFHLQQRILSGFLTSLLASLMSWLLLFCVSLRKEMISPMNASTCHLTLNVLTVFSFIKILRFFWSFLIFHLLHPQITMEINFDLKICIVNGSELR